MDNFYHQSLSARRPVDPWSMIGLCGLKGYELTVKRRTAGRVLISAEYTVQSELFSIAALN